MTVSMRQSSTSRVGLPRGGKDEVDSREDVFEIRGDEDHGFELVAYHGTDEAVVLPAGIDTIGRDAFLNNTHVRTITARPGVTRIGRMAFAGCTSLETIVFERGDVVPARELLVSIGDRAFWDCPSLKHLELGCEGTSNPRTWTDYLAVGEEAFKDCTSLEVLDFSCVNLCLAVGSLAFVGCSSLAYVDLGDALAKIDEDAFYGCGALEYVRMPRHLCRCRLKDTWTTAYLRDFLEKYHPNITVDLVPAARPHTQWGFTDYRDQVSRIVYRDLAAWWEGTSAKALFCGFSSLKELDLEGIDTSGDESLACMFKGCVELRKLDLSPLDTSAAKDLRQLFFGCRSLRSLDLSVLDTSQVETMAHLLHNCHALEQVNLAGLDLSRVRSLWSAFDGCSSLTELDLSSFRTPALEKVSYLFRGCTNLRRVDLRGLNLSQVKSLSHLFCGCTNLRDVSLAGLDLHGVTNLDSVFEGCSSLEAIDLSGLEGAHITKLSRCFAGCSSLTELDLFRLEVDLSAAHDGTHSWFEGCSSLKTLRLPKVLGSARMDTFSQLFDGCSALECWRAPKSWPVEIPAAIPQPTADCGMWWSTRNQKWMKVEQICRRGPVPDTYTNRPAGVATSRSGGSLKKIGDMAI